MLALVLDVPQLGVDLGNGGREPGVGGGGQVDQVVFLDIKRSELAGELSVEQSSGCFFVFQCLGDVRADAGDELGAEPQGGVVSFDGFFDAQDVDVWGVTGAGLFVPAEEVGVLAAVPVDDVLDDHSSDPAGLLAASAEDAAFQVVVVDSAAFCRSGAGVQKLLDTVEQARVDERLVTALVLLAVMCDEAEVVTVAEHLVEFVDRRLLGGVFGSGPGAQPAVVEFVGQIGQRPVAAAVELECEDDEGAAFGVDGDGADLAAFGLGLADIQVAELGLADAAAVLDFLAHFVLDVGPAGLGLVLVDGVDDGLHQGSLRAFAHVEHGGNDPSSVLLQVTLDHAGVDGIPKDSVEVIDDDVVDVSLGFDPSDHVSEPGSSVDARGTLSWLDEFVDNVGVE
ncbi:MAG TPA: hypothetical protein VF444_19335 [Pseudonocardiaceae bacterium]